MEDFVAHVWRELSARLEAAEQWAALWRPTVTAPDWMAPGLALGGLLALVLLSGVALLSLGILLTALLMAVLLMQNVFGLTFELPR